MIHIIFSLFIVHPDRLASYSHHLAPVSWLWPKSISCEDKHSFNILLKYTDLHLHVIFENSNLSYCALCYIIPTCCIFVDTWQLIMCCKLWYVSGYKGQNWNTLRLGWKIIGSRWQDRAMRWFWGKGMELQKEDMDDYHSRIYNYCNCYCSKETDGWAKFICALG